MDGVLEANCHITVKSYICYIYSSYVYLSSLYGRLSDNQQSPVSRLQHTSQLTLMWYLSIGDIFHSKETIMDEIRKANSHVYLGKYYKRYTHKMTTMHGDIERRSSVILIRIIAQPRHTHTHMCYWRFNQARVVPELSPDSG